MPDIVASNYPLVYFAERLFGSHARVDLPVPPDQDPAFWKPSFPAIALMQKAELVVLNGADYEKWLPKVALSRLKLVDTTAGFKNSYIVIDDAVIHSHGPDGEHSHAGTAFTTWLDFTQAAQQADALASVAIKKYPGLKTEITHNLQSLQADLRQLDDELRRLVASNQTRPLFASHPVYQYLARRYGLNLKSVHWEANEMPAEDEWKKMQQLMKNHHAQWMIWESLPDSPITERLNSLGIKNAVFDPCANRPEQGDFLSVMRRNIENLSPVFN
ncbi:metal ABC transporter substrate-binding protein [Candidatus Methylospira mobilis]|uniref:metal ABC transporter substrate-binding protein n=1 Tax=Candidatus Methylospira mobilis TaxID=1808979 RepID=UPI0028E5F17E|nr:metal ABC transporter substrate-binding protein [Candidatus Methylospira mobilis]WNV03760.1 metal ABC transporter substrate-binding protein [Candidatus Methylospira mobilis]